MATETLEVAHHGILPAGGARWRSVDRPGRAPAAPPSPTGDRPAEGREGQAGRCTNRRRPRAAASSTRDRHHRVPVQPEGTDHRQDGQMGEQARQRRQEAPARRSSRDPNPASSPWRCSSTPPPSTTAAWSRRWRSCSPAACRPTRAHGKNKPMPPLVVFHWGAITSFPAYVTQVSAKYTLFTAERHPDPRHCAPCPCRRCRGETGKQNPTSGSPGRPQHPPRGRRRHPGLRRLPRVRRPDAVAAVGRLQRHRRPAAAAAGHVLMLPSAAELLEPVTDRWRRPVPASSSNRRLAAARRREALLVVGLRRRQPAAAGHVRAAVPRPGPDGASPSPARKIGSKVKISVASDGSDQPGAADRGRGHRAGGGVRHHRDLSP